MEAIYQRRCAQYIYVVPEGLRELMSDISREVLREQPNDLYVFITQYLEALMITRENARVAARAVSHMAEASEIITELLQRTNMTRDQANKTVQIIQKAFRKHLRQKETRHEAMDKEPLLQKIVRKTGVSLQEIENAVIIIQRAYRLHRLRRSTEREDVVDWRKAFVKTMELYRKSRVSDEEAIRAATLIKAAYKGYYTRRVMRKFLKEYDILPEEEQELAVHTTDSWQIRSEAIPEEEEAGYVQEELEAPTTTEELLEKAWGEQPFLDYEQIDNLDEEVQVGVYEYESELPTEFMEPVNLHEQDEEDATEGNEEIEAHEITQVENEETEA